MAFLTALWMPIVLSAIIVFIVSSIMHTVLKYHQSDCRRFTNEDKVLEVLRGENLQRYEDKVLEVLRGENLQRGLYIFPFSAPKDMKSPAMVEKYTHGPVGMMT